MTIFDNSNNNNSQVKISEARKKASAKYTKKTYKTKSIYIKLTDLQKVEEYLQKCGYELYTVFL